MLSSLLPSRARTARGIPLSFVLVALAVASVDEDAQQRVERRANVFTGSRQDGVAVAQDASGATVLVWQSRRQQDGTYGIYARRFGPDGTPGADEVQVNATTHGMQMQPAVALDANGTAWFAWRSFGHDGDQGAILARRFAPGLDTATAEVVVNQHTPGHQTDPVLAALPDGGALVAWLSPGADHERVEVHARRLGPDGAPRGDAFVVATCSDGHHRTPAIATDGSGSAFVAYGRTALDGTPRGLYTRAVTEAGPGVEQRVDVTDMLQSVEPAIAACASSVLIGWLEADGDDYGLRVRSMLREGAELRPRPVRELRAPGTGYTSAIDVALDADGRGLVTWNRHADGPRLQAGLWTQKLDGSGVAAGEPFRVTERSDGAQGIAPARGTSRTLLSADGRMAFAWHGDAGLGDESGAHLTLIAPADRHLAQLELPADAPVFDAPEAGARPHDPPTFDPRDVNRDRTEDLDPSVTESFLAFTSTGWTPPDPEMAVGPDHIVCMVNGGISWFLKDGTQQFFDDINGSGGFYGSVGAGGFVFDPEVVWDPHAQRFIAFANERKGGQGRFLLAVSDDADPNGTWHKYAINCNPLVNDDDIDSPNISVDDSVIYMGADYFGPDKFLVVMVDKTSVLNGGSIVFTSMVINGRQSFGMPVNYDTNTGAQYMIWANEFTTSTSLRIYAITDPLTNPQEQFVTVSVPSYSHPADPPQQGSGVRPELFEARFWSAVVRNGSLWAVHHQGQNRSRVRWYEFDLEGWPASGNPPTLVQSANVGLGAGIWGFFPSIWVDADDNMALSFARSATDEFISMQMTYRLAGDAPGTVRTPETVRDSTAPENSGRWGDYSATNDDPAEALTFWGHHEYYTGSWRTRVGKLELCDGSITNYCVTSPNSVGSGSLMTVTGTPSIAANDLVLNATDCPPNQFGLFYYGQGQVQNPQGDGFMCIGSNFVRLPAIQLDGAGQVSFPLDLTNLPPMGQISAGETWDFQWWYRDPPFGSFGYNFSDAVEITFCP